MKKFMRTRSSAPPPAPLAAPLPLNGHAKLNGHANGGVGNGVRREDQHSTISSRYWGGSGGGSGGGDAGAAGAGRGGELWQDPEFPPNWRSIGDKRLAHDVVWMRPHELSTMPVFRGDGCGGEAAGEPPEQAAARWQLAPGELGAPALCAAAAALSLTPRLLTRVIPPHSFTTHYTSVFRFKFWVFGSWVEVCVDDLLPTRGGRLLASQCSHRNDFTLPLLEKAYAKLYGGYACVRTGSMAQALQDLSGGVVQSFPLSRQPRALSFRVLNSAVPRSSLLVAAVDAAPPGDWRRLRSGLIAGQPYCVTGLARVRAGPEGGAGAGALVRLRAAGGRGEWGGAWARGSAEWRALPEHDRDLLAHRATHPAEFWMSFGDFASSFTELSLVHVGPDDWMLEPALHGKRPWRCVLARRRWRPGYNAGGDPTCTETTSANPQFHVQIPCALGAGGGGGKCHVVVSVTQQYAARGAPLHSIGFALYEAGVGTTRARHAALHELRALDVTHESRARETATFFTLPPGDYLLVPHTRRPHTEAAFLLRILTDEQTNIWEVNEDNLLIRNISAEFMEEQLIMPVDLQTTLNKLIGKEQTDELDARGVQRVLRGVWRACLAARPSLELCRALLVLRDLAVRGRMPARELPPLVAALAFWKHVFVRVGGAGGCNARVSSYRLRALLWAAGVSASNKVLECVVLRYARRRMLHYDAYVMALARLHLAHERYRNLESKMKSNPLSLEEMILMTIYS